MGFIQPPFRVYILTEGNPALFERCPGCHELFEVGDKVTLVPRE